ncbi:MAG: hypothetical protein EA425_10780 [Puniceicoccaceae bacterium]|nr:MAG: hypothetical protein EA425_10780 [Puniceicoccaceae bacterium]
MPETTPARTGVARRLWRGGCQCCLRGFCLLLTLLCLLVLVVGGYLLLADDIPVPRQLVRLLEERLQQEGFASRIGSIHFDPTGQLLLANVALQMPPFEEPVLLADHVLIGLNWWELLRGNFEASELRLNNARLMAPAVIAPGGVHEPIISSGHATLRRRGTTWRLDHVTARIGHLRLDAAGTLATTLPVDPPAPPIDFADILGRFVPRSREFLRHLGELDRLEQPRLRLRFDSEGPGQNHVRAEFSAVRIHLPEGLRGEHLWAESIFPLSLGTEQPATLRLRLDRLLSEAGPSIQAITADLHLPGFDPAAPLALNALSADFSTGLLTAEALRLAGASGHTRWSAPDQLAAVVRLRLGDQPLELEATADLGATTARIAATGTGGADWLDLASAIAGRDLTYYADITQPPDFQLRAAVGPGWTDWREVDFRVHCGPITARGVSLDRALARGTLGPDLAHVSDLRIDRGDETARGSYQDRLQTRDYRFLLRGALRPHSISPWFGPWWDQFWEDAEITGTPARADLSIAGNWEDPEQLRLSGRIRGDAFSYRSVRFSSLDTRLLITHNHFRFFQATATRPEGRISGGAELSFDRPEDADNPELAAIVYSFSSDMDLAACGPLFEEGGIRFFKPYGYTRPPVVRADGWSLRRSDTEWENRFHIFIESEADFVYLGWPLEQPAIEVVGDADGIQLPGLRGSLADGRLQADVFLSPDQFSLTGNLRGADLDRGLQLLAFLAPELPPAMEGEAPDAQPPISDQVAGGRFSLDLEVEGPEPTPGLLRGRGNFEIEGADFGTFQLLGILSELLQPTFLHQTTIRFSDAYGGFALREGLLDFSNLTLTGPNARLRGEGTYAFLDDALDFRARLNPFRESGMPLFTLLGLVLDPLSFVLELRLDGSLASPNWRFLYGPSSILRGATPPSPPPQNPAAGPRPPSGEAASAPGPGADSAATPPSP